MVGHVVEHDEDLLALRPRPPWRARPPTRSPRRRTSAATPVATRFRPWASAERAPSSVPGPCSTHKRRTAAPHQSRAPPAAYRDRGTRRATRGRLRSVTRIVIMGGGPAGYEAALVAAQHGGDVTVVERDGMGGACVLDDCVPSKTLIASAGVRVELGRAPDLGFTVDRDATGVDLPRVNARVASLAHGAVGRRARPRRARGRADHPGHGRVRRRADRARAARRRGPHGRRRQRGARPPTSCSSPPAPPPASSTTPSPTASASSPGASSTTSPSCPST